MGFLVEALRDRGVEAYGFDISDFSLSQAREGHQAVPVAGVGSHTLNGTRTS